MTVEEVRDMKTSDPRKEALAWLLKTTTTMSNGWITERLQLGHASRLCHLARTMQAATSGSRAECKAALNSTF